MAWVARAKLSTASLLLAMLVELGRAEDRKRSTAVRQCERGTRLKALLVGRVNRQRDGHRLVRHAAVE